MLEFTGYGAGLYQRKCAPSVATGYDLAYQPSGYRLCASWTSSCLSGTSARTLGPAPLTMAAMPLSRKSATRSLVSGMAAARYPWCSRSSVASNRNSGDPVSARSSNAVRAMLNAASASGTTLGRTARAWAVYPRCTGTNITGRTPAAFSRRNALAPGVLQSGANGPGNRESTEQAGDDVIRVALLLGCQPDDLRVNKQLGSAIDQTPSQQDPARRSPLRMNPYRVPAV